MKVTKNKNKLSPNTFEDVCAHPEFLWERFKVSALLQKIDAPIFAVRYLKASNIANAACSGISKIPKVTGH